MKEMQKEMKKLTTEQKDQLTEFHTSNLKLNPWKWMNLLCQDGEKTIQNKEQIFQQPEGNAWTTARYWFCQYKVQYDKWMSENPFSDKTGRKKQD